MGLSEERYVCASDDLSSSVYSKNYPMLSLGNRLSVKANIRTVVFRASENMKTIVQNLCIIFLNARVWCTYQFILEAPLSTKTNARLGLYLLLGLNFIYLPQAHEYAVKTETRTTNCWKNVENASTPHASTKSCRGNWPTQMASLS